MSEIKDFPTLFSLNGKIAVVTGGSRGLGLHAATGLLLAGCSKLIITSRKAADCAKSATDLKNCSPNGAEVISIPADLSKPSEVTRFVTEAGKFCPEGIDILLANAGAVWGKKFDTHSDSAFVKVMDLNVRSVFNLVREITPLLEKRGTREEPSRVLTIGSVAGLNADVDGENAAIGYSTSKAAVIHLTKNLALVLGPRNILCNCVAPGFFPSKMADALIAKLGADELAKTNPTGRIGRNEDIAGIVVFLCSRAASHVNGVVVPLDGGKHLMKATVGRSMI